MITFLITTGYGLTLYAVLRAVARANGSPIEEEEHPYLIGMCVGAAAILGVIIGVVQWIAR